MFAQKLIVYHGQSDFRVDPSGDVPLVYRIGGGTVVGEHVDLNDPQLLNSHAEQLRDAYARWVRSYNDTFVASGFVHEGLSLFFIGDFSCKRSEVFETYATVCNLSVLKTKLAEIDLKEAQLIGVSAAFAAAFVSVFPSVAVTVAEVSEREIKPLRSLLSTLRYLAEMLVLASVNSFARDARRQTDRIPRSYFFSIYPQMFSSQGKDIKYGELVGDDDCYAVTIVADGLHQHVTPRSYWKYRRKVASQKNVSVVDDFIRVRDVLRGLQWFARSFVFRRKLRRLRFEFDGINLSECVNSEMTLSFSRIVRLVTLMGAIERFGKATTPKQFTYYLHEFPLGRMISYVLGTHLPATTRTGFQHGPASWRKLFYFLSEGEASVAPPYVAHAPIPDAVYAEDEQSRRIYEKSGYQAVVEMERIYRLGYLDGIVLDQIKQFSLIVPGLHDVRLMMNQLFPMIAKTPGEKFVLKLHPRSNKVDLSCAGLANLEISDRPVHELLGLARKVYVTYSSVGQEAKSLGIDVEVVDIPGVVNESPLLECCI